MPSLPNPRERLTVYTLARVFLGMVNRPKSIVSLASAYLLHTAFLNHLSLEERHFAARAGVLEQIKEDSDLDEFLELFFAEATKVVACGGLIGFEEGTTVPLCDFVDGRLLLKLLTEELEVPEAVAQDFERLAAAVRESVPDLALSLDSPVLGSILTTGGPLVEPAGTVSGPILPFSNPLFDQLLDGIKVEAEVMDEDNDFDATVTREQYRPYKAKKPYKEVEKPQAPVNGGHRVEKKPFLNKGRGRPEDTIDKRAQGRVRKWEQVYLGQMQRYAASLIDSVDGSLNQKLIICEDGANKTRKQVQDKARAEKGGGGGGGRPVKGGRNAVAAPDEDTSSPPPPSSASGKQTGKPVKGAKKGQPSSKKAPVLSKADQIKLENAEKAVQKEAKGIQTSWKNLCNDLRLARDDEAIISRLDEHIKKLHRDVPKKAPDDHEGRFAEVEVRLYKIMTLQKLWITLCKVGEKAKGYNTVAVLFDEARKALQSPALTVAVKTAIQNVFAGLGIALPPARPTVAGKRAISFTTTWTGKSEIDDCKLNMTSEEFQLTHFGPYMDRNMDSAPDDRVPFEPDAWQRKVLDEIDADRSVFVGELFFLRLLFLFSHCGS